MLFNWADHFEEEKNTLHSRIKVTRLLSNSFSSKETRRKIQIKRNSQKKIKELCSSMIHEKRNKNSGEKSRIKRLYKRSLNTSQVDSIERISFLDQSGFQEQEPKKKVIFELILIPYNLIITSTVTFSFSFTIFEFEFIGSLY